MLFFLVRRWRRCALHTASRARSQRNRCPPMRVPRISLRWPRPSPAPNQVVEFSVLSVPPTPRDTGGRLITRRTSRPGTRCRTEAVPFRLRWSQPPSEQRASSRLGKVADKVNKSEEVKSVPNEEGWRLDKNEDTTILFFFSSPCAKQRFVTVGQRHHNRTVVGSVQFFSECRLVVLIVLAAVGCL